jgi:hypothetical protein
MTALIIGPLTPSQIEHAEWAISPMQDMAGDEDWWYGVDDLRGRHHPRRRRRRRALAAGAHEGLTEG